TRTATSRTGEAGTAAAGAIDARTTASRTIDTGAVPTGTIDAGPVASWAIDARPAASRAIDARAVSTRTIEAGTVISRTMAARQTHRRTDDNCPAPTMPSCWSAPSEAPAPMITAPIPARASPTVIVPTIAPAPPKELSDFRDLELIDLQSEASWAPDHG